MNKKIVTVIGIVVLVAAAFFLGTKIGEVKQNQEPGNFQRQGLQGQGQMGQVQGGQFNGNIMNKSIIGEITAKDDTSITISLPNGGSKIIYLSDSTQVTKSTEGSIADLEIGTPISVNGNPNSNDGTITANTIQINPVQSPKPQTETGDIIKP
ncbi:MAG: hypothetical protein WC269_03765 [Candidatus Gracilibacteria bacterium]|jgi:hypothetical protein